MPPLRRRPWFPFTAIELEIAMGAFAFLTTCLAFLGIERLPLAWTTLGYVAFVYLAGLLVHARRTPFAFICDGALHGSGYLPYFRRARRSLLLLHTDDDPPGEELLGLYRALLERGVELRRVIFVRPDAAPGAYAWVRAFGRHAGLKQRVVLPERADVMRVSFVVVDERWVMIAVPGDAAIDAEGYASRFVLRHLLVVEDPQVAEAFTEVHSQLWRRASELEDEALLADPARLAQALRRERPIT